MREFRVRCSSLSKLMTEPRSKAEGILSVGAKTYVRQLARESIFGVDKEFSSKETEKGTRLEGDAIALLNSVTFSNYTKNTERRTVGFLTGEPDIVSLTKRKGIDLKCAWSIFTFPITLEDAKKDEYLWQMRGYMKLFELPEWEVAYALLDTPEDLIGYEPTEIHEVGHIEEHLRLTVWRIERDLEIEKQIDIKINAAYDYFLRVIHEFEHLHGGDDEVIDMPEIAPKLPPPLEHIEQTATKPKVAALLAPAVEPPKRIGSTSLPDNIFA